MFLQCFSLLVFLSPVLAATKFEDPNPRLDCSKIEFNYSYVACTAHDYSQCCPLTNSCCAGGCCSADSICVNVGTSKEGCCPILSRDTCGADIQSLRVPVTCFSSREGTYECPHGAECTPDGGCAGGPSNNRASSAKTTTTSATADDSSTQTASKTSSTSVVSRADPPEATATSSGGSIIIGNSGGSSATAINPNAAFIYIAAFSSVASVILAVILV